ncbi:sugar ABC transporter substrate-binding protein [Jiella sp. MQZ9-1]|uniref:Sugar ABC transporter substrate-binding protein n=2 Tax=Jiella flava TaxID=2816857 RepID=A0A939JUH5_9HYPH|nr:sugar ABC transporter substrate-binding protein [Jiella flava]MBO0663185.1 sugar ABC transporter substrate-binding protein [Jiella flava]MCD2471759.1 sugar ABC transporter substrate-binding protein [Jiella flava]
MKLGVIGAVGVPSLQALDFVRPSYADSTKTVANLFDSLADEWFIDEVAGAAEAAAALGLTTENMTFGNNPASQLSQVQDGVTRGIQMFAVYAPLGQGLTQMVRFVGDSGHLAFEYDIPPWTYPSTYGPAYGFYVNDRIAPSAYASAKRLFESMGGKGNVVVMSAFPGGQHNEGGEIGFKQALDEFPGIKVLAKAPGKYSREPAQKLMSDWLVQFPQIDALLSYADTQSLGAYTAMQQAGRTNIKIASINGQIEGLQAVKDGKITTTVFLNPFLIGGWRTVRLFDLMNGWKPSVLERMFWLESDIVDQSNVDKYLSLAKSKPSPYDWKKMSRTLNPDNWESQGRWYPINPVDFWKAHNLGKPEPADWLPADVKAAVDAGEFEKLLSEYKSHIGRTPI